MGLSAISDTATQDTNPTLCDDPSLRASSYEIKLDTGYGGEEPSPGAIWSLKTPTRVSSLFLLCLGLEAVPVKPSGLRPQGG